MTNPEPSGDVKSFAHSLGQILRVLRACFRLVVVVVKFLFFMIAHPVGVMNALLSLTLIWTGNRRPLTYIFDKLFTYVLSQEASKELYDDKYFEAIFSQYQDTKKLMTRTAYLLFLCLFLLNALFFGAADKLSIAGLEIDMHKYVFILIAATSCFHVTFYWQEVKSKLLSSFLFAYAMTKTNGHNAGLYCYRYGVFDRSLALSPADLFGVLSSGIDVTFDKRLIPKMKYLALFAYLGVAIVLYYVTFMLIQFAIAVFHPGLSILIVYPILLFSLMLFVFGSYVGFVTRFGFVRDPDLGKKFRELLQTKDTAKIVEGLLQMRMEALKRRRQGTAS